MECKEAQKLVKPYIDREIRDKDLEKFLSHISKCSECYEELEINFTIFSALMQLDDSPDLSYNINAMLLEELNASRKYIKRKKRFRILTITIGITLVIAIAIVLALQLGLWPTGTLWMWR
jgi:hypothetical protein